MIPHSRPTLGEEDLRALSAVLSDGMLASGGRARRLEDQLAARLGLAGARATSSGSAALLLALAALEVGPGDEVVLPTYVCRSVWRAVRARGAAPVLCDVEDEDWCASPATVELALTPRTKAVIVVHPFGIAADASGIRDLGVPVIEDACQALGAPGVGQAGELCVLSFEATKLLAAGEGGAVSSRRPELLRCADAADQIRHPLSDLQAALALSQLARFDAFLARRRALAERYLSALPGVAARLPSELRGRSVFFRFPLRVEGDRFEALRAAFAARGVHVRRGVDALLHREFAVAGSFPGAEACFRETLSLPLYPSLSDSEQGEVIAACRALL